MSIEKIFTVQMILHSTVNIVDASAFKLKLYKCFWNSYGFITATEVKVRADGNASWDMKMLEHSILYLWTILKH